MNLKDILSTAVSKISIGGLALAVFGGNIYLTVEFGIGLSFWVLLGIFIILTTIFIISFLVGKKNERKHNDLDNDNTSMVNDNDSIVNEDELRYKYLIDFCKQFGISEHNAVNIIESNQAWKRYLMDNNLSEDNIRYIINKLNNRKSILKHNLFTTFRSKSIELIEKSRELIPDDASELRKSIPDYILYIVNSLIDTHYNFFQEHEELILDETNSLSVDDYKDEFLKTRMEIIKDSIRKYNFNVKLVSKFTIVIEPAMKKFDSSLLRIAASSMIYNDYMRFYMVLDNVITLLEWITVDYLDMIIKMNGELEGH